MKAIKANAKQYEKEGWVLDGTGTFVSVLTAHHTKLEAGATELVGDASGKKSINMAKTIARNNAINEHAEYARSMIRARMTTDLKELNEEQQENFAAGYERLVIKEMDGALKPSFYMYRQNANGSYDIRAFFVIDQAAIVAANRNAIKEAAEDAGISSEYAKEVVDLINNK